MERTLIGELAGKAGQEVLIQGFVDVRRDQGKLVFFDFRDRSGTVQGVVLPGDEALMAAAKELRSEFVVSVTGIVNQRPEKNVQAGKVNGGIELEVKGIEVLSAAEPLPFDPDTDLNLDTLFDYRPLTLRRKREEAIFRVQHELIRAYRAFLTDQGFTEFQSPKIVGDDAEGGAGVFRIDYFDKSAYLATSPQLYKQILVGAFERVFTAGSMFRAEKHSTTRHMNELAMLDFEMGFVQDHTDVMRMVTALMRAMTAHVAATSTKEFDTLSASLPTLGDESKDIFPSMKLREAQELIKRETGADKTMEPDLEPEDERWLSEYAREHLGSDFLFVTHYPVSKRPFYTMEDPADPGYTRSFDLLFRGVELMSGAQRVHEPEMLIAKMREKGLDPEKFSFYLQAFRYGIPPHGGMGMGLERLTQKFLGLDNVKEASLFPRDLNRIDTLLSRNDG
jgi:nondiscriminating aspartyl-tRNA synthetase